MVLVGALFLLVLVQAEAYEEEGEEGEDCQEEVVLVHLMI